MAHLQEMLELSRTPDFDSGMKWVQSNPELVAGGYGCSKEAVVVWTMEVSWRMARRGIRVNCTGPGVTDTPLLPQFEANAGKERFATLPRPIENRNSTAEEQAHALIFLNSDAASYVAGSCLWVDAGYVAAVTTGQWKFGDPAQT
jgi:NAD(P)-dependent dehydrogenase (short-subunit alcohol dehydrogenase family)